jgi:hypothetical protein
MPHSKPIVSADNKLAPSYRKLKQNRNAPKHRDMKSLREIRKNSHSFLLLTTIRRRTGQPRNQSLYNTEGKNACLSAAHVHAPPHSTVLNGNSDLNFHSKSSAKILLFYTVCCCTVLHGAVSWLQRLRGIALRWQSETAPSYARIRRYRY